MLTIDMFTEQATCDQDIPYGTPCYSEPANRIMYFKRWVYQRVWEPGGNCTYTHTYAEAFDDQGDIAGGVYSFWGLRLLPPLLYEVWKLTHPINELSTIKEST